jgi:FkbM family methyltransferase
LRGFLSRLPWVRDVLAQDERVIHELRAERLTLEQHVHELQNRHALENAAREARLAALIAKLHGLSSALEGAREEISDAREEIADAKARLSDAIKSLIELLLDRPPRNDEIGSYLERIASGADHQSIVNEILLSSDGRKHPKNRERFGQFYDQAYAFPSLSVPEDSIFPIHIVDVGAQVLSGPALTMDHVYQAMLQDGRCRVVGFEPLQEEAEQRMRHEPHVMIFPYFIGNGEEATFHINAYNPTSSLLPSNPAMTKFRGLSAVLPTKSTRPAKTHRLDDIAEIAHCDYLKIDVQGFELSVLRGAERLLGSICAVHLEVEHEEVYLKQPLFSEIDAFLRSNGFELIDLFSAGYDSYRDGPPGFYGSRLLWNDALYLKRDDAMSNAMLLKAAYISHVNYRKYDLAAHLLAIYDQRAKTTLLREYGAAFRAKPPDHSNIALKSMP